MEINKNVLQRRLRDQSAFALTPQKSYQLMPTYWSFRPKDFLDMRFEEGEDELNEEAVTQQVHPK